MTSTRSNAVSTHQDLIPKPHTRTPQRVSKGRQRKVLYKNFLWASQKNFHTSTNAEHRQDLNGRDSWGGFQQDRHTIFSQGPVQDHARTPRGCTRTSRSSHKDLYKILFLPRKIDIAKTTPSEGRACAVAHGQGTFLCENSTVNKPRPRWSTLI